MKIIFPKNNEILKRIYLYYKNEYIFWINKAFENGENKNAKRNIFASTTKLVKNF